MKAICSTVMIVALSLTAACSHNSPSGLGVASTGSPKPTSSSGGSSGRAGALAYSQCMRAHGIKDFPDPNSKGDLTLNAEPGSDLDFNNPTFKAADNACKALRPPPPASLPSAQLKAANLKYAKCMRAHGISDFPDPKSDGTLQIQSQPGSDLDPNNQLYQAADKACRHFEPGGGQGSGLSSNGGSGS